MMMPWHAACLLRASPCSLLVGARTLNTHAREICSIFHCQSLVRRANVTGVIQINDSTRRRRRRAQMKCVRECVVCCVFFAYVLHARDAYLCCVFMCAAFFSVCVCEFVSRSSSSASTRLILWFCVNQLPPPASSGEN